MPEPCRSPDRIGPALSLRVGSLPGRLRGLCSFWVGKDAFHAVLYAPLTDRQVVVLMDNDTAGDAAAAKAHTVLAAASVDQPVTLVPLPVKDAAQLLQEQGPDALRRSLADRRPLADLVVDRVEKLHHARWGRYDQQTPSPEARLNILWAAAPIVAVMPEAQQHRQNLRLAENLTCPLSPSPPASTNTVPHRRRGPPATPAYPHPLRSGPT